MTGTLLGATFSWGCNRANTLGLSSMLKEYALSGGKSHPEEEIRQVLQQLLSYKFYQFIAQKNGIDDPFDLKVIMAHWIGNQLLDATGYEWHHNSYAKHKPKCQVSIKGRWLYHLGKKRIRAKKEYVKKLETYGEIPKQ